MSHPNTLEDKDFIKQSYANGMSFRKIHVELKERGRMISPASIMRYLKREGIYIRTRKESRRLTWEQGRLKGSSRKGIQMTNRKWKPRECEGCKNPYVPRGQRQRWCSDCVPDNAARARASAYGITHPQLCKLLDIQAQRCAVCSSPLTENSVIDHDHATGQVRGVLCTSCNSGLGWLEKPGWVEAARAYLQSSNEWRLTWQSVKTT